LCKKNEVNSIAITALNICDSCLSSILEGKTDLVRQWAEENGHGVEDLKIADE
jgi:hypothetical protein